MSISYTSKIGKILDKFLDRDTYSTTEKVVGTWIDGKPIYQKTFAQSSVGTFNHNIANIDKIITIRGRGYDGGNAYNLPYYYYYSGSAVYAWVYANSSTYTIGVNGLGTSDFIVILEYTKTTD